MEFVLAFLTNLRGVVIAAAILSGIAALILAIVWATSHSLGEGYGEDDVDVKRAKACRPLFKRALTATLAFALVACLPTIDELWSVRIALIKYELASPENVQKATDEIARIGKKLECKYLGGCEAEKGGGDAGPK